MADTSQSTRDHLIDVGLDLMHRRGYQATGVADILSAAEVPKGSFYHHFGSKEDFAAAALERYVSRVGERAAAALADSKLPPLKRLRGYFSDLIKVAGQSGRIPGCMMGRFTLEIAADSPQLRKLIESSFTQWQGVVAKVLEEAVVQKQLPADTHAQSLAGFLLNNWEGALLRSQAEESDAPLETFMHYVFDELLTKKRRR
jgi:TetR/AcrR family transcriptional repressor of nem operon